MGTPNSPQLRGGASCVTFLNNYHKLWDRRTLNKTLICWLSVEVGMGAETHGQAASLKSHFTLLATARKGELKMVLTAESAKDP